MLQVSSQGRQEVREESQGLQGLGSLEPGGSMYPYSIYFDPKVPI